MWTRLLKQPYVAIVRYLRARLNRMQYILLVALLTGLVSGLLAVCLKLLVHYVQEWVTRAHFWRFAYLFLPLLGLFAVVWLVRRFFGGRIEKGITMVLKSVTRDSSFIPLSHTYLHVLTSSLTVGLGGSAGLEAPIVATGAATGSNLARMELRVAIEEWLTRIPTFELADPAAVTWTGGQVRGPRTIPVRWSVTQP